MSPTIRKGSSIVPPRECTCPPNVRGPILHREDCPRYHAVLDDPAIMGALTKPAPGDCWRVLRIGAVHFGLWAPGQATRTPPICKADRLGEGELRAVAAKLNAADELAAAFQQIIQESHDSTSFVARRVNSIAVAALRKINA